MKNINRDEILNILRKLKKEIETKYKVKEIGLFGSYINDKQKSTSDIDILVEFDDGASLLDLVGLSFFLEKIFGKKIDVISKNALKEEIRDYILETVIYV